jgi:hypothetical protein
MLAIGITIALFLLWKSREAQLKKMFGYNNQQQMTGRTRGNPGESGFENLAYDANNSNI